MADKTEGAAIGAGAGFLLGGPLGALAGGALGFGLGKKRRGPAAIDYTQFYDRGAGIKFDPNAVRGIYQQVLGRDPSQNEIAQFQKYIEMGDLGYQDVAEIIGGGPEAQSRMLEDQTTKLEGRLGASDDLLMGRAMSALESRYRQLGRPSTTGFDSSFARSAQDLALSRQDALNNFYSSGLTGLRDAYAGLGSAMRQRGYKLYDDRTEYNRAINVGALGQAYQRAAEDRSLEMQRRMAGGQLAGTLLGAGIGASMGGPLGAYAGGTIGSGVGANYGLLRR